MQSRRKSLQVASAALAAAVLLAAAPAAAQTWAGGETTPALSEIVAIDATGEPNWLYGAEDVEGDGANFMQQEQSIDIRTVYASTDANRFWARVYVSDDNAVGGNVTIYVFVDVDQDPTTGGSAIAPEIDAAFVVDPTDGGYEFVIQIDGNGTLADVWAWDDVMGLFVSNPPAPADGVGEAGSDVDPILINAPQHGYLQASVDLALVGLTSTCDADLFVRSANQSGASDLDAGLLVPCVPADANGDDVPDVLVPPAVCTSDADCPGGGICSDGICVIPVACVMDSDCSPGFECSPDGFCVPEPGGSCTTDADCGDLICDAGTCVACDFGGTQCGSGRECAPNGRCVLDTPGGGGGFVLIPGGQVQGGACACSLSGGPGAGSAAWALGCVLLVLRRRSERKA